MANCLGLYIENNLIKYAKVSREKDTLKVESYGVKFYDNLTEAVGQIISETDSFKIPIACNIAEENYNYFHIFSMLKQNDIRQSITTEFESFCFEKGLNSNTFATRYTLVDDLEDKDKIRAILVYTNKMEVDNRERLFHDYQLASTVAVSTSIPAVAELRDKETTLIVNLEANTTVTTVMNKKIYSVDKFTEGMENILNEINQIENSYPKAYDILKNTTIFTADGNSSTSDTNPYLGLIRDNLEKIVQNVKIVDANTLNRVDSIYITGTGSLISNIDLYFGEYFKNARVELLRPYFIPNNGIVNIKDYMEVNSALSLALTGLGIGIKELNFYTPSMQKQLNSILGNFGAAVSIGNIINGSKGGKRKPANKGNKKKFSIGSGEAHKGFDSKEKWLLRSAVSVLVMIIVYIGISVYLTNEIDKKKARVSEVELSTAKQIDKVNTDIQQIKNLKSYYDEMVANLIAFSEQADEQRKTRDIIPEFLMQIMSVIPKGITVESITSSGGETSTPTHMTITANAKRYDELGYFKSALQANGILKAETVESTNGLNSEGRIVIVIEGDLP